MAASESDATALRQAFVEVGIDPTGIDLAWLAELKAETERQISAARADLDFPSALPIFAPHA